MLYVVGDSNSVRTAPFLLGKNQGRVNDRDFCKEGAKTEDVLARLSRSRASLDDATAFFVFVGLNDHEKTGAHIHANVMLIINKLKERRPSDRVPIFVAPPFCAEGIASESVCDARKQATELLVEELRTVAARNSRLHLVTKHLRQKNDQQWIASKPVDALHLTRSGYQDVANEVNGILQTSTTDARRRLTPKVVDERLGVPAPPPRKLWAEWRERHGLQMLQNGG